MFTLINSILFLANNHELGILWLQRVPKNLAQVAKNKDEQCSSNTSLEYFTGEQPNWEQVDIYVRKRNVKLYMQSKSQ